MTYKSENTPTETHWEGLYKDGIGSPKYPNGHVARWLFRHFPRQSAGEFQMLDMGCGAGRHTLMMAREGYQVRASDHSENALAQARNWAREEALNIDLRQASAESQPFKDASFDGILSYAVLYYLPRLKMEMAFDEIYRLLKNGGKAFIMVKNHRDIRAEKGDEVAPHEYLITQTDEGMPWNNEQNMQLTLLPRAEIQNICRKFSHIMIDEMTCSHENGLYREAAWLIYLVK